MFDPISRKGLGAILVAVSVLLCTVPPARAVHTPGDAGVARMTPDTRILLAINGGKNKPP